MASFGVPVDAPSWVSLVVGCIALAAALAARRRLAELGERLPPQATLAAACLASALLSAGYVAFYLRGGPRIIDATAYLLEARTFAGGELSFATPLPQAAFAGRFLVPTPTGDRLAVLFPPGWPALLALGVKCGAPLAVGPLLAAALTWATHQLARAVGFGTGAALGAALLSTLSAALRYHTADTMAHGFAALLFALALLAAFAARDGGPQLAWCGAGLGLGALVATRPVTGVVLALGLVLVALPRASLPELVRRGAWIALGATPGLVLLLAHQHAITGEYFGSTQLRYYALADGPPGCFRYGFGHGIGCRFEHGDFIAARGSDSHGLREALLATGRRLRLHLLDVGNVELFGLAVPLAAWMLRREPRALLLSTLTALVILAYAPFYFDGSYPGGGARFFADALPLEHVLVAGLAARASALRFVAPAALIGFALHAVRGHAQLAAREGGRPMFEPSVLAAAGITRGLVFVDTDHGFSIAHRPGAVDAQRALVVARARFDAHDRVLYERLGSPPSHRYVFDWSGSIGARIEPWIPPPTQGSLRFEGESLWPPIGVDSGYAHPEHLADACISRGRGLRLRAVGAKPAQVMVELSPARAGRYEVVTSWGSFLRRDAALSVAGAGARRAARFDFAAAPCATLSLGTIDVTDRTRITLTATGDDAVLDAIELRSPGNDPQP